MQEATLVFDGACGFRRVVRDVIPRTGRQNMCERLAAVGNDARRHQGIRDMRAPHRRAVSGMGINVRPRDRIVLRQQFDHPFGPGQPCVAGFTDFCQQTGVGRVVQVGQDVDADPLHRVAGHFHAGYQPDAVLPCGRESGLPARRRVVVGQRDYVQACGGSRTYDVGGRLRAVRDCGVCVQIDSHATNLPRTGTGMLCWNVWQGFAPVRRWFGEYRRQ